MSALEYVREDGAGNFAACHVPDLVVPNVAAQLVFVFESPHVDELQYKLPVVGASGRSALRFLAPDAPRGSSLGAFVRERGEAEDGRLAVVNVCNVPMQAAAFVGTVAPDITGADWSHIGRVRRSRALSIGSMRGDQKRMISQTLADGLRRRLSQITLAPDGVVIAAGAFAQRTVSAAVTDLEPGLLNVPHPSFNQWHRASAQTSSDLHDLKERFANLELVVIPDGRSTQG